MTDEQIVALCRHHGAKACSDAAYAAMEDRRQAADALGFGAAALPVLYRITVVAYNHMSDEERVADLTGAVIKSAKLP